MLHLYLVKPLRYLMENSIRWGFDGCFFIPLNLDQTKEKHELTDLKAFAGDKLKVVRIIISSFDWVANILGKSENAGYQHFHLFNYVLAKGSS